MDNQGFSYEFWREPVLEIVDRLHQEILQTPDRRPYNALLKAYEMLTDEQKIAFILTGGVPSLLQWLQLRTDIGGATGQLPVLC